jgi:hypothetical protein
MVITGVDVVNVITSPPFQDLDPSLGDVTVFLDQDPSNIYNQRGGTVINAYMSYYRPSFGASIYMCETAF